MSTDRTRPANFEAYGELVKEWSKNRSAPESLPEFEQLMTTNGVGMPIPDRIQDIRVVYQEEHLITIVVPLKRLVEETEAEINAGNQYNLPNFYEDLAFHTPPAVAPRDRHKFFKCRVGDYTSGQCA